MATRFDNTVVTVNDLTFTYLDAQTNAEHYLELIKPLFSEKVWSPKEGETTHKRLFRLFENLYKRTLRETNTTSTTTTHSEANEYSCLDSFGVSVSGRGARPMIEFKSSGNRYRISREALKGILDALKANNVAKMPSVTHNIKIGVEMEFIGNRSTRTFCDAMNEYLNAKGQYFSFENRYIHNDGRKWILGRDGSVRTKSNPWKCGWELTSRILDPDNMEDMLELKHVIELVKEHLDGEINTTCGLHVHISTPWKYKDVNDFQHTMYRFCDYYRDNENCLFDKLVAKRRAGYGSRYARTCSPMECLWSRYKKLNLSVNNYLFDYLRCEVRQMEGSLDYERILGWIKLQRFFFEKSIHQIMNEENGVNPDRIDVINVLASDILTIDEKEGLMRGAKLLRKAS